MAEALNPTELRELAAEILNENDREGRYTVPTKGLYPFQWNWDSCLTALGWMYLDEDRAWREIETLFEHQWSDGMVPHIVFHEPDDGYFPGPDVWSTGRAVPTSGITQPPVAGFVLRRLYQRCADPEEVEERVEDLVDAIDRWHAWFFENRDPQREGLVSIIHPWEAGRDNSVDWDQAFERVPTEGISEYTRRDTEHANPEHRPTKEQYDRYLWLVEHFRSLGWDNSKLHDASPFQVVDPGFNAILIRSCFDLAALAEELEMDDVAQRNYAWARQSLESLEDLWSDQHRQYLCQDRTTGQLIESSSVGGLLAVFAPIRHTRAQAIAQCIEKISAECRFSIPSHDPADSRFDAKRYWRGPVWLIINYMINDGLEAADLEESSTKIVDDSLQLIGSSGFAEYYDPKTGEACGGGRFTWTAAMVLEFLQDQ